MANIRIDADGLQNNISSMRAYINELDSLNARTQTLMTQIASSWEGEASTAYINIMTERYPFLRIPSRGRCFASRIVPLRPALQGQRSFLALQVA